MKVQNINSVNFGKHSATRKVESGEEDFIFLNQSDKLTVIYDMLCEQKDSLKSLSDRQYDRHNALKSDLKTLSLNQKKMHDFNKNAFDYLVFYSSENSKDANIVYDKIWHQYKNNKLDIIG